MVRRGDGWLITVATLLQGIESYDPIHKDLGEAYRIADLIDFERRDRNRSDRAAGLRDEEEE